MNAEEAKRLTREFRESEDAELYKLIKEAAQSGYNYVKIDRKLSDKEKGRLRNDGFGVRPVYSDKPTRSGDYPHAWDELGWWISWE